MPGRIVKRVTVEYGRDRGKVFELTEMPSDQGERWASRFVLAFMNAGGRLPEGALEADGIVGLELTWRNVFVTGVQALQGLRYSDIGPLLEELKPCIRWCPPGNAPVQDIWPGENSQIEEIRTWYDLYFEYIQLLVGFSLAAVLSTTGTAAPETSPAS